MDWLRVESASYWGVFVGSFLLVAVWESFRPLRVSSASSERRWSRHAIVLAVTAVVNTLVLRVSPVFLALAAADNPYGLLNSTRIPYAVRFVLAILLLDFVAYAAHRLVHAVPMLWRLHEVHHSDPDYDVSTAGRFHPLDAVLRHGLYLAGVFALAPPLAAVLVSELLIAGGNMFVHANCTFPEWIESGLRKVIITPQLHRVHHSEEVSEQNCNYGQFFSWWDQGLRTFRPVSVQGTAPKTGIRGMGGERMLSLSYLLLAPFRANRE